MGLLLAVTMRADELTPRLRDVSPKIFSRELRRAIKNPEVETKTCSIPLLEMKGDRRIDPEMDKMRIPRFEPNGPGLFLRNEPNRVPNPAPTCKDWNKKPF